MPIIVRLDVQLALRKMSLTELAGRIGITVPNLSVLKNGHAKALRITTLEAICRELGCQPGDLLEWQPERPDRLAPAPAPSAAGTAP